MRNTNAMANRVARKMVGETESNEALRHVDDSIDDIIIAIKKFEANLPKITPNTVRQKAAIDAVKELMDEGVIPYFADVVIALKAFDD